MSEVPLSMPSAGRRRWWRLGLPVGVFIALLVLLGGIAWSYIAAGEEAEVLRRLGSKAPHERQLGAWLATNKQWPRCIVHMAHKIETGQESDADVRESFIHALGRVGQPELYDVVAAALAGEENGFVRQAAWLALARLDAARFKALAESRPPGDDAWDQIGLANGWLVAGDTRGVPTLFHWAREGNADQRLLACGGLHRSVLPLLEATGRWPLNVAVQEGHIWPPELVAEAQRRCAELDLQRVADALVPRLEASRRTGRDTYRMTSARNWIAKLLFAR